MGKQFALAVEVAFYLLLVAALAGAAMLWHLRLLHSTNFFVTVAIPAVASLVLTLLSLVVPNLVSSSRLVFPLNVTLPIVHAVLMIAVTSFLMTSQTAIQEVPDQIRIVKIWDSGYLILATMLGQMLVLTVWTSIAKKTQTEPR